MISVLATGNPNDFGLMTGNLKLYQFDSGNPESFRFDERQTKTIRGRIFSRAGNELGTSKARGIRDNH
jgi:hypothetical protein